ncbi:hypothetical protein BCR44DRAFT_1276659 [Catenaria anguillulae PL171]|uniref:CSC1/OSCA1-like 7TM region domain-containing protein n=1 Tax=Catenaria anguillulae PL171 TaxID=765915 RepID=A0A1Y2H9I9_9FUNG|nr:hypothetical protein BCR44DRAFT_1276659 [Catenaria anguillulae PL171]
MLPIGFLLYILPNAIKVTLARTPRYPSADQREDEWMYLVNLLCVPARPHPSRLAFSPSLSTNLSTRSPPARPAATLTEPFSTRLTRSLSTLSSFCPVGRKLPCTHPRLAVPTR